ncbi:MAG: hypothetical protein AAGJ35_04880, partial [Myxococcota bacterium]
WTVWNSRGLLSSLHKAFAPPARLMWWSASVTWLWVCLRLAVRVRQRAWAWIGWVGSLSFSAIFLLLYSTSFDGGSTPSKRVYEWFSALGMGVGVGGFCMACLCGVALTFLEHVEQREIWQSSRRGLLLAALGFGMAFATSTFVGLPLEGQTLMQRAWFVLAVAGLLWPLHTYTQSMPTATKSISTAVDVQQEPALNRSARFAWSVSSSLGYAALAVFATILFWMMAQLYALV